jgi:pilus assembly protein Flp/PilA
MGAADRAPRLSDAARRRTADLSPYGAHMIRTAEGPKTMLQNLSSPIIASVVRFARDERGATAIEYALVASGIAVAIASTVVTLGSAVKNNLYGNVATALK